MSSFKGFESDLYENLVAGEYEIDEPNEPDKSEETDEDGEENGG